jgi:hypothetical protein
MTISSEVNKSGPYTGDGANTSFAYGFKIYHKNDISVIRTVTATGIETVLTVDVDYTVNDVGSATGTITATVAPTSAQKITIIRDMDLTQEVDFENQGGYYPEVVEQAFDRAIMISQQLEEELDRAVKVDASSATTPDTLLDAITASVAAAALSETNAGVSETNAAASEAAADADATATAADAIATAADAVATAADRVQTGLDAAATAADAISTAADAVSTDADATAAAASAAAASTSETNAATSETNAGTSETNAAASYDSFDDRYLGAKASAPTLDNDGDPLLTGALYWNTTTGIMNVYNGAAWEQISGPYEAIDADILRADTTDNLSVGYTCDLETLGSDTITADFQTEGLKSRAVVGNVTLNVPTTGNGIAHIKLAADASGPYTVTLGSGVTAVGTIPDLAASTTYIATIMRFATSDAYVQIQEAG